MDSSSAPPADAFLWGSGAVEHYQDRLAWAAELDMDAAIGSPAEQIARREAMRVAAGIPVTTWPSSRGPGLIDVVLAAFPEGGGLRFVGFEEGAP